MLININYALSFLALYLFTILLNYHNYIFIAASIFIAVFAQYFYSYKFLELFTANTFSLFIIFRHFLSFLILRSVNLNLYHLLLYIVSFLTLVVNIHKKF